MTLHDPGAIAAGAVSAVPGRPAVALIHDHADARVVVFRIAPGERVARHTSRSSVILSVVSGAGYVEGADGERAVVEGEMVTFAPGEPHGMRADGNELVLSAIIAPRPGG